MAARPARPGSGRVWAICAHFPPRHWCPAGRSTPHGSPPGFRLCLGFRIFSVLRIFARSGRRLAAALPRRQKFAIFHSLRRRAGERRRGALKVIAYTLWAMPNSLPCVMPSDMTLFLCPRPILPLPLKENMLAFVLFLPFRIAFFSVSSFCRLPLQFEPLFFEQSGNSEPFVFFPGSARLARSCALPFSKFSRSLSETILLTSTKWSFSILLPP